MDNNNGHAEAPTLRSVAPVLQSLYTLGFVVDPKYGIAFDTHHNHFLTIFCEADLKAWEKLKA